MPPYREHRVDEKEKKGLGRCFFRWENTAVGNFHLCVCVCVDVRERRREGGRERGRERERERETKHAGKEADIRHTQVTRLREHGAVRYRPQVLPRKTQNTKKNTKHKEKHKKISM